jgi:hypothetical protein
MANRIARIFRNKTERAKLQALAFDAMPHEEQCAIINGAVRKTTTEADFAGLSDDENAMLYWKHAHRNLPWLKYAAQCVENGY